MLLPQPHDFSVEIVRLDRAQPALEALPRRPAPTLDAADRSRMHLALETRGILLVVTDEGNARGLQARHSLAPRALRDAAASRGGAAQRVDGVAEIRQQLPILPPHDAGLRFGVERRRAQRRGDCLGERVRAGWITAEMKNPASGRAPDLNVAWRQVIGRAPDEHAIHVRKALRRHPLVCDAVLGAEDGKRARRRREGVERRFSVLCLGCEQQDIVAASTTRWQDGRRPGFAA